MAIGPVDFQPIMSRVNEVARIQNGQQQKIIGNEVQQAEAAVRQAEQNTKSVHKQDQANKVVITDKEKERNSGGKKQNQSKDNEEREEKKERLKGTYRINKKLAVPEERHIDIRL